MISGISTQNTVHLINRFIRLIFEFGKLKTTTFIT